MDFQGLEDMIRELAAPLLEEECLELFEIRINKTHSGLHVVLLVDKPAGGVTVGTCARLNRMFGDILESRNAIEGRYVLEVSSPGVDRSLKNKNDFLRCEGKQVKFLLTGMIEGKVEWDGYVRHIGDEELTVEAKGRMLVIPYGTINKAKLIL